MSLREELEYIHWEELSHAYGSAKDTPRQLLALLSEDDEVVAGALDNLWASICHQGSVYEASCAAIPFLIQILERVPVAHKPGILALLAGLAHRDWYADRDQKILQVESNWRDKNSRNQHQWWEPGKFLEKGNEFHEAEWMQLAHDRVGEGMPIFLKMLEGRDLEVLLLTLYLVSCYKEKNSTIVSTVKRLFVQMPDYLVCSAVLLCLSTLLDESELFWEEFSAIVESPEEHPLTCFVAAYALSKYHRSGMSQAAVKVLVDTAARPQMLDEQFQLLPWGGGSVHVWACESLARCGDLPGLIKVLEHVQQRPRPMDTVRVVETLLDTAFFGDKVHERYWGYSEKKQEKMVSLQERVERIKKNDGPQERRSYYWYSSIRQLDHDELEIDVYGHDEIAAAELNQRFELEGVDWLTGGQRRALEAVLRCETLWQVKNETLKIYGLPMDREHLERLVNEK